MIFIFFFLPRSLKITPEPARPAPPPSTPVPAFPLASPAAIRQSRHSFPKVEKYVEKKPFLALHEIHKYITVVVHAVSVCVYVCLC